MKIGILGTRGIPNRYGGFEECAQQIGTRLVARGHQVLVYSSHRHPYQEKDFEGVEIIHKYDPEHRIGTAGQFVYDLNCILDARWRDFDILLMLGYTSSSIWQRLLPKTPAIITNMDGLEWRRSKYSKRVRSFLKRAEKWAANGSNVMIADAKEMRRYLYEKYQTQVIFIPYGAEIFKKPNSGILEKYGVEARNYNLIVARLEPENNLEMMLAGLLNSASEKTVLIVGNHQTSYGEKLKNTFKDSRLRFIKPIFNKENLNNLRFFSHIYFHGHSSGGTNPSLLEAMACQSMICAHNNPFNQEVLSEGSHFFKDEKDVARAAELLERNTPQKEIIEKNLAKIKTQYDWDLVTEQYEVVMEQSLIK